MKVKLKLSFLKFLVPTIFTALAIAVMSATALAATISFNPNLVGAVTVTGQNNPQLEYIHLNTPGNEPTFGNYQYDSDSHLHLKNGAPSSLEGKGSFVGQNGDRIDFNFQVQFTPDLNNQQYPYSFTGKFQVTGGAGRFEKITGNGDITAGGINLQTGTFFGNWSAGSLRAPLLA